MPKRPMDIYDFIERCEEVYGDRYDYLDTELARYLKKVTIMCKKHGEFTAYAINILRGYGCKKCKFEEKHRDCSFTGGFNKQRRRCYCGA